MPSSNCLAEAEAEQPHHASAQPDAAVPMDTETPTQEQGHTLEQHSLQGQQKMPSGIAEGMQKRESAPDEQVDAGISGPAHDPDRKLAEQAAKATLAALNVGAAHPMNIDAEHRPASALLEEPQIPLAEQSAREPPAALNADSARHLVTTMAEAGEEHARGADAGSAGD